jgi:hypothetical protein
VATLSDLAEQLREDRFLGREESGKPAAEHANAPLKQRLRDVPPQLQALIDRQEKVNDARTFILGEIIRDAVTHGDDLRKASLRIVAELPEDARDDALAACENVLSCYRSVVMEAAWDDAFEPTSAPDPLPRID